MITFQVGEHYATRSFCDWDCIFRFEVVRRTAKTVTIFSSAWGEQRRKVRTYISDGVAHECIDPLGRYSMSPVLVAGQDVCAPDEVPS